MQSVAKQDWKGKGAPTDLAKSYTMAPQSTTLEPASTFSNPAQRVDALIGTLRKSGLAH